MKGINTFHIKLREYAGLKFTQKTLKKKFFRMKRNHTK